jgi:hypothetical protein
MSLTNFNVNGIDLSYVFQRLTFNISGINSTGTTTSNGYNYNYYRITSGKIINVTNGFGKRFYYLAVGGGGGGAADGHGGNAGEFRFGPLNTLINNTISCDIASGGLGTSSAGDSGGTTIIGFFDETYNADIYINGGNGGRQVGFAPAKGGSGTNPSGTVVPGSAGSGSSPNFVGGAGGNGFANYNVYGYLLTACGGGGGRGAGNGSGGAGGIGGGGAGSTGTNSGGNATNFGSGGGGGWVSRSGGDGSPGLIIFFVQQ